VLAGCSEELTASQSARARRSKRRDRWHPDGLRWWNRWRRESDLRSRLRKNGLQRAALDDRRSVPDVIGEQKAM